MPDSARPVQAGGGFRTWGTRPLGRAVFIAIAVLTLAFGLIYLSEIIGIAALLLFGLALPIYAGWKRPRSLALAGLVILLLAAPLASVLVAQGYFSAPGRIDSFGENHGALLQNATVSPFNGGNGAVYTFEVTVHPEHLYNGTRLANLTLFVTTCPDATEPNQSVTVCTSPFPWYRQVHAFNGTPTQATPVEFTQKLPGPNLWWWTMWATYLNATNATNTTPEYVYLNSANGYADIQGPVAGDFLGVLGIVLVPVYLATFLYPGLVFFAALAFYMWFKAREARRKAMSGAAPAPPGPTTPPGPPRTGTGPAAPGAPASGGERVERTCPNCRAVVYANETQCWKCGTPLSGGGASPPLPSAPPPAS